MMFVVEISKLKLKIYLFHIKQIFKCQRKKSIEEFLEGLL